MRATRVMASFILLLLLAAPAAAQGYGSITGIVSSSNNANVPDATVALWSIETGSPVLANVSNNPQLTTNYSSPTAGMYAFTNVPDGLYNVTAQWNDYWYYTTVNLQGGTATANIVIPNYIEVTPISTPEPTPKTYYAYVPIKVSSPLPQATTRSPGFEALIVLLAIPVAGIIRKRL